MYNPYNWKINKENEKTRKCMCLIDELMAFDLELNKLVLKQNELKKDLEEVESKIYEMKSEKLALVERFADGL